MGRLEPAADVAGDGWELPEDAAAVWTDAAAAELDRESPNADAGERPAEGCWSAGVGGGGGADDGGGIDADLSADDSRRSDPQPSSPVRRSAAAGFESDSAGFVQ